MARAKKAAQRTYLIDIPPSEVRPSPLNPRGKVLGELDELVASVKASGVLQPIVVRFGVEGGYEVVCGHRRLEAARRAGLPTIPAIVRELDDGQAIEVMLTENSQRRDIDPLQEADAINSLIRQHRRRPEDISSQTGRSLRWVRQRLTLSDLCPEARRALVDGDITLGAAVMLAAAAVDRQREILEQRPDRAIGNLEWARWMVQGSRLQDAPWGLDDVRPGRSYDAGPIAARVPFFRLDHVLAETCTACRFRTDFQLDLLNEGEDDARCTRPACWSAKLAHWKTANEAATLAFVGAPEVQRPSPDVAAAPVAGGVANRAGAGAVGAAPTPPARPEPSVEEEIRRRKAEAAQQRVAVAHARNLDIVRRLLAPEVPDHLRAAFLVGHALAENGVDGMTATHIGVTLPDDEEIEADADDTLACARALRPHALRYLVADAMNHQRHEQWHAGLLARALRLADIPHVDVEAARRGEVDPNAVEPGGSFDAGGFRRSE